MSHPTSSSTSHLSLVSVCVCVSLLSSPPYSLWVSSALVREYESELAKLNPTVPTIDYDVTDLYAYLDSYADLSAMVYVAQSLPVLPFPSPVSMILHFVLSDMTAGPQCIDLSPETGSRGRCMSF